MVAALRPQPIHVPGAELDDLRRRLRDTRWPAPLPADPWQAGADLDAVGELCRRWADEYDWRVHEAWWNAFAPVAAPVDGVDIHVWRIPAARTPRLPLLLIHGWPGSVVEFRRLIEPLATGAPAYDLVIPSIPGFGFGGKPAEPGWNVTRIAEAFHTLMTERLGYERYGVQGGDWGAIIGSRLAQLHPEAVAGFHTTMPLLSAHRRPEWADQATAEERAVLRDFWDHADAEERGYSAVQGTKPQSLGVAHTDSPAGLATWILEKFQTWSERGLPSFDPDDLLTNLMFYWAPRAASSAAMIYREARADPDGRVHPPPEVPTAVAAFPAGLNVAVRRWAEPHYRIARWTPMPHGGHFPALEQPELLAADVREFFATVR